MARPAGRSRALLDAPRPLHSLLRDQQVIAGIGRTWVDEILHAARLSPFKRGDDLSDDEAERAARGDGRPSSAACSTSTRSRSQLPLPEKFPKPTRVHAHQGEPCPRCETVLEAVFYEDYVMTLLPALPDRGPRPQGPPALAAAQVIEAGTEAPDFTLPDQDGERRHAVVDCAAARSSSTSTPRPTRPGCTTQACGIRDHRADYDAAGATVLGVSPDPVKARQEVPRRAGR